jgi:hypothetical protein
MCSIQLADSEGERRPTVQWVPSFNLLISAIHLYFLGSIHYCSIKVLSLKDYK